MRKLVYPGLRINQNIVAATCSVLVVVNCLQSSSLTILCLGLAELANGARISFNLSTYYSICSIVLRVNHRCKCLLVLLRLLHFIGCVAVLVLMITAVESGYLLLLS